MRDVGKLRSRSAHSTAPTRQSLFLIDFVGTFEHFFRDFELPGGFDGTEETRFVTFVAGGAVLGNLNQEGVTIAIERDIANRLGVSAFLAFHPELLAGTTPEMSFAGFHCLLQRSTVHPGHHQDTAGGLFLNNCRDQSIGSPLQFIIETHGLGYLRQISGNDKSQCGG